MKIETDKCPKCTQPYHGNALVRGCGGIGYDENEVQPEPTPANEGPKCQLCGEPMPKGEEMFFYHGYSGPCPKPPLPDTQKVQASGPIDVPSIMRNAGYENGFKAGVASVQRELAKEREKWEKLKEWTVVGKALSHKDALTLRKFLVKMAELEKRSANEPT